MKHSLLRDLWPSIQKSAIAGIFFTTTAVLTGVAYAALSSGLSVSDKTVSGGGGTLSATSWNRLVDSVLELDARTAAISSGKVVNVTFRTDCTRVNLPVSSSVTLTSFTVDKKRSDTTLLIQGSISGWGNYSWEITQGWKLGSWTEAIWQGVMYDENSHGKTFPTMAVISGHSTTGPQTLTFRYYAVNGDTGNRPFVNYNPNASDDARLAQTCSVYTVWEIAP